MHIEICVPAHNEADIIEETIRELQTVLSGRDYRITVVDNGSTDETAERARNMRDVRVITLSGKGKGLAVTTAAQSEEADIFGFIDADLSADPKDLLPLIDLVNDASCDIAIGSRLTDTNIVNRSFLRTLSSRIFNMLRKVLLGIDAQDTQCGLKVMNARGRTELAACTEKGWFFDMEFLARAERSGLRILEVPVHWNEHRYVGRESKLRMIHDGFGALNAMLRIRQSL